MIIAGITTYNPNIERLVNNIEATINQVDKLLIVDNNSLNKNEIKYILESYRDIDVIWNEKNLGIASAMNEIGKYAVNKNASWFMTLDQDSIIKENSIKYMIETGDKIKDVGIVSPAINRYGDVVEKETLEYPFTVISSGNLVNTDAWKKVNGFFDYLFIDEVDHEFCYRLRKANYKIVQDNRVVLEHILGEQTCVKFLGHTFKPLNHSAMRRYYIARNSIILGSLYKDEKYPFPHRNLMLFKMFISIICVEKDKVNKCKSIIKGVFDAWKWLLLEKRKYGDKIFV